MPVTVSHPIWTTPLRDLVRGRVTGRLDWRRRLARSSLPGPVQAAIGRVVRRTRLWRTAKVDVAAELIAHFADGLDAGESPDALLANFGDERVAARLIRRAQFRRRSLPAKARTWAMRGVAVVAVLYAVVLARYLLTRPNVATDYLARINASALAFPEADRAWPLYLRAAERFGFFNDGGPFSPTVPFTYTLPPELGGLTNAEPGDAAWPQLTRWLDAHADGLTLLRAAKPTSGIVFYTVRPRGVSGGAPAAGLPLVTASPAELEVLYSCAYLLNVDLQYAVHQGDGRRAVADVMALFGVALHRDRPAQPTRRDAPRSPPWAVDAVERLLNEHPGLLSDADLVALAHRVAVARDDAFDGPAKLDGVRTLFLDAVQHVYSDDGHGDGRLTPQGLAMLPEIAGLPVPRRDPRLEYVKLPLVSAAVGSMGSTLGTRREMVAEYDRLTALAEAGLSRPLRDWPAGTSPLARIDERSIEIRASPLLSGRYPLIKLMPSVRLMAEAAEVAQGRCEGIAVGLALELYRRRHGTYPRTLDDLVPTLLPVVPADRVTGQPVRYRIVAGRPVVYSVGMDRDDDGGRGILDAYGSERREWAAAWLPVIPDGNDGDWLLYDARPTPAPPPTGG